MSSPAYPPPKFSPRQPRNQPIHPRYRRVGGVLVSLDRHWTAHTPLSGTSSVQARGWGKKPPEHLPWLRIRGAAAASNGPLVHALRGPMHRRLKKLPTALASQPSARIPPRPW